MAANALTPFGLIPSRLISGAAPTWQTQPYNITSGYASKIGVGDVVSVGTAGNQGRVIIAPANPTNILGVFCAVLPYYDTVVGATFHGGPFGSYPGTSSPASGFNVPCAVYVDPMIVYRVQASGGPYTDSMTGNNVNWLANTNGAPGAAGISTLAVDLSTVATTNTLPLRIVGVVGVPGGPQDPANTNPVIEVMVNFSISSFQQATGI